jgi:hypothetical protein
MLSDGGELWVPSDKYTNYLLHGSVILIETREVSVKIENNLYNNIH